MGGKDGIKIALKTTATQTLELVAVSPYLY